MIRVGSLFAGIGGFDLAAEGAGLSVAWQVEIDPQARRVLARHWPDVPRYEDVRSVDPAALDAVDVVCGGVPCQDWSVAGKRAGLSGGRAGLFHDFARLADRLAPHWLCFENVPGLLSAGRGEDFAAVLAALTGFRPAVPGGDCHSAGWRNAGFCSGPKRHACWRVLDSRHWGVAQSRRRLFVIASTPDAGCVEVLFEPEGGAWYLAEVRPDQSEPAHAPAGGPGGGPGGGRGLPLYQCCGNRVTPSASLRTAASLAGGVPFVIDAGRVRRLTPKECLTIQGFAADWLLTEPPLSESAQYRLAGNAVCVPVVEWILARLAAVDRR